MLIAMTLLIGCGEKDEDTAVEPSTEPSGEPSSESVDEDGDGVVASDDCDDSDPALGATELDADCDGVLTEFDCDDADEMVTDSNENDADCDGTATLDDCDDSDASSTVVADDGDCDGVLTADDCDDGDATLTAMATDADCDGVLTADDCDDADDTDATLAGDCDGDGVPASEDCNDLDAGIMSTSTSAEGCCANYQLVQNLHDFDADGVFGTEDMMIDYLYNASGQLESETYTYGAAHLDDFLITYTYNTANQVEQRITSDGWFTITTDYSYDGNGNLTHEYADDMSDGYVDTTTTYSYDGNNNRTSHVFNISALGTYYAYDWTYNIANQMTTEEYSELVNGTDYEQQYDKEWEYTSSGLLDFYTHTNYYNGYAFIEGNYASYTYNSMNQLTEKVQGDWDWCCSEFAEYNPTSTVTYQYDSDGNLQVESVDSNNNGSTNRETTYTYSPQGLLLEEVFVHLSNPAANYTHTWTYDLDSNLIMYEVDSGSDGIPDEIVEYIFECE